MNWAQTNNVFCISFVLSDALVNLLFTLAQEKSASLRKFKLLISY